MPVLILAALSVILFIVTLILLGFAEAAETRKMKRLDLGAGGPFRVLSVGDAFEKEYAVLWETQIPALCLISAAGRRGVPEQRLLTMYRRTAKRYPELYDGTCFQQWLEFLEGAELVSAHEKRVVITPQGQKFLKYRVNVKVAA